MTPPTTYSFESEVLPDKDDQDPIPVTVQYTMEDIGVTMIPKEDIQPVIQSVASSVYGEMLGELKKSEVVEFEELARQNQDMLESLAESARFAEGLSD
jgi:hypothetical protein